MPGPDAEVKDATRSSAPGRRRYSQAATEPQSWPSRWTVVPGPAAAITAPRSSASLEIVYAETRLGTDELPTPRLSYRMIRNRSDSRETTPSHSTCESGQPCAITSVGPSGLPCSYVAMRTPSTLSTNRSVIASPMVQTLTVLQLPPSGAFPLDAAAGIVVAHSLRIADLLHVVHRDLQPLAQPPGTGIATRAAPRPFAVAGHQYNGDLGDRGLRLYERLDARMLSDPLPHVCEVGGGVMAATTAPRPAAPKPVEQSQLGCTPFGAAALHLYR